MAYPSSPNPTDPTGLMARLLSPEAPTYPSVGQTPGLPDTPLPSGQSGAGPDWSAILKSVMPFVMAAIAGKQGGRAAAGHALTGYTVMAEKRRQDEERRLDALAAQAADQQDKLFDREFQLKKYADEQARQAGTFVQQTLKNLSELTDPAQQAALLQQAKRLGTQIYGLSEEAWNVPLAPNTAKLKTEAQAVLKALEDQHGEDFPALVESGATVPWQGQQTKIADLQALANVAVTAPTGEPVAPPRARPKPVNEASEIAAELERVAAEKGVPVEKLTRADRNAAIQTVKAAFAPQPSTGAVSDFESYLNSVLDDEAAKLGTTRDKLNAGQVRRFTQTARKEYGQADDKPVGQGGLNTNQELTHLTRMQTQWDTATKDYRELKRQSSLMHAGLEEARKGNLNAGGQAVLVTFQKILDPTSVVRETEYARSAAGQALLQRIEGWATRLERGGTGLTLKELESFTEAADQFLKASDAGLAGRRKRIEATAKRYGLDPALIFDSDIGATPAASFTWTTPDGQTLSFPSQKALDDFKKRYGG